MNYEIHITVNQPDSIERFKEVCNKLGIKPLVIATGHYDQVMTSSIYKSEIGYGSELKKITRILEEEGFNVIRQKVEIMPSIVKHKDHIYYESHVRIKVPKYAVESHNEMIDTLCRSKNLHKSKNLFKVDDEFNYQMVTYRTSDSSIWDFGQHMEEVRSHIGHVGLWFDKIELEECIYDSNIDVDKKWLEN